MTPTKRSRKNNRVHEPESAARMKVATNGGWPESRRFPPFLRKLCSQRTLTPLPSRSLRTRFRPRDRARECGCLPISLIARDAASARLGAKCWSELSESSRSRGKGKRRIPESGLIGAAERYQALLPEVRFEVATPVFPRHPGCL